MEKVEIEIRYEYDAAEREPFMATVKAMLQTEEGETGLKKVFRNSEESFFGGKLRKSWGIYNSISKYRYEPKYFSAASWEELEEKVRKYIEEEIKKLAKVVQKNYEMMAKKPADRKEVYYILEGPVIKKEGEEQENDDE